VMYCCWYVMDIMDAMKTIKLASMWWTTCYVMLYHDDITCYVMLYHVCDEWGAVMMLQYLFSHVNAFYTSEEPQVLLAASFILWFNETILQRDHSYSHSHTHTQTTSWK
jgi:hypothetical protein